MNWSNLSPFIIMEAKRFPILSKGFGLKVMDENGNIFNRVNNTENQSGNLLVYGQTIDTVICINDGKPQMLPIFVPNNIFSDEAGQCFLLANEKNEEKVAQKASESGCAYLIARKQPDKSYVEEAWLNGERIDFPQTLWNEMGVAYKFVNYAQYGEICKRIHGYYLAKKVEPIYVFDSKAGDTVKAVLNGVKEHETFVEEGETMVQNVYHGETYKMKLTKLRDLYDYAETTPEGYQLWKPKHVIQTWTFTNENIFGVLWGGFEFLAKAMINLTDANDVYGCNYAVFNGDDTANGSHIKLKLFLPAIPLPKTWLQKPEIAEGYGLSLEEIPKTDYIECPLPMSIWQEVSYWQDAM